MRFAFIDVQKAFYPITVLCAVLEVARSGFYAWRRRAPSLHAKRDAHLALEVAATHKRNRRVYGSPRVHADLNARGVRVGKHRVARLMREQGLKARRTRRFVKTTDSRHFAPLAPNLLERNFETSAPNEAWVGDVTYVSTNEGWLFLAVILDLFARRVVGWAASATNDSELALAAVELAVRRRKPTAGLVHHTDRGSPYASDEYRRALSAAGMVCSMSRAGNCWDNAVAESFFATLKAELVDAERYPTRAVATESINEYIDSFYNPVRRHSHLNYLSPIEFELKSRVAALAA